MENNSNNNAFSNFGLRSILEKEKLKKNNFLDWSRNLRIVLKHERKLDDLESPIPNVTCLMLASMVPELQKQFMDMEAFHFFAQLQAMFLKQARTESFETISELLGMLKISEQTIPSKPKKQVLTVQKKKNVFKKKGKPKKQYNHQGKGKKVARTKVKVGASLNHICFYCNKKGHWKRNCLKYLKDKKDRSITSTSGAKEK